MGLAHTYICCWSGQHKDYWITELSEEGKEKHPDYFITLENADQIIQLHSRDAEPWVMGTVTAKGI